jgi:hypothetical protein
MEPKYKLGDRFKARPDSRLQPEYVIVILEIIPSTLKEPLYGYRLEPEPNGYAKGAITESLLEKKMILVEEKD